MCANAAVLLKVLGDHGCMCGWNLKSEVDIELENVYVVYNGASELEAFSGL
jgi:hypothetical protein